MCAHRQQQVEIPRIRPWELPIENLFFTLSIENCQYKKSSPLFPPSCRHI